MRCLRGLKMIIAASSQFREAFEKEAGLKHMALAGALALGSHGAKAGGDAAKTTLKALKQTPVGQQVSSKIKSVGKSLTSKVKSLTGAEASIPDNLHHQVSANAAKAAPGGAAPKVSLKDLGQVNLKYDDLSGTVGTKGVSARYNINKETFIEAFNKGKDSGVRIGYNKAF